MKVALPGHRAFSRSAATLLVLLASAGPAAAATFVVNRTDDVAPRGTGVTCLAAASSDCSLREAVIKANATPGSTILFAAATNGIPITLTRANPGGNGSFPPIVNDENAAATGDLDVTSSLTIQGNGETNTIIQAGTNASNGIDKVFGLNPNCDHAVSVVIDAVTIRFGRNNQATSDPLVSFTGGGLDFCGFGAGSFTLSNSTVSDSTNVNAYGGGINLDTVGASSGTITLTNVKVLRNSTLSTTYQATGGGLNAFGEGYALTVTGATFDSNVATGAEGGGVFLRPTRVSTAVIHASTFSNNSAGSRGGGLSFLSSGDASNPVQSLLVDQGTSFTGNVSGTLAGQAGEGGGLYVTLGNANSSFSLSKATVTGNSLGASVDKRGGGGLAVGGNAGSATVAFTRIVGNSIGAPVGGANQGTGLHKDNNGGTVNAVNNWWGCSTGPSAAPCDTTVVSGGGLSGGAITATTWLRDSLTAPATTIVTNQSTNLTASVNTNSASGSVAGNVDRLLGRPIAFSAVGGTISLAQATVQPTGTATATYTASAAGAGRAAAVIDVDGTTPPASNVLAITVNPAATTTTISSALPDPSVTGQGVAVTWGVVGAFGNLPTAPTGTVTVTDGAATCSAPVAAGGCNLAPTTAGSKTLTASYGGDANFGGSTSAGFPHLVNKAGTTTTVVSSVPGPSVPGQAVVVSVSPAVNAPGAGTPTGTISVTDGVDGCVMTLPATSCTVTPTTVGTRSFVATYGGDASFNSSVSSGLPHTVNQAATTTVLSSALPEPSVVGQTVTATFTVSVSPPSSGTPAGTVTVGDGVDSCTVSLPATSCTLVLTTPGVRSLAATYAGDPSFAGSVSAGLPHTVNAANTTTTVTNAAALGATPSVVGQPVSVTFSVAAVAPGAGTPAGNVTVSDGVASCTGTVAAGSCAIAFATVGARTVTATYAGSPAFSASASAGAPHTVDPAATTTAITSDTPDPSSSGQAVVVSFTVSVSAPGAGTPAGNVTVTDGVDTCTATVAAGSCSISLNTVGPRTLVATYAGSVSFSSSASAGAAHAVTAAATTTAITNAASLASTPSVVGQTVAVTFTVAPNPPAVGTPTGNVTVSDGVDSCTAAVAAGGCSLTFVTPGARTVTATYAGDAAFAGSVSAGAPHTVNAANTTTTVTNAAALGATPSVVGQPVSVTFSVAAVAPGAGTLAGSVTVSDGVASCTGTVAAGSCAVAFNTVGTRTVTATYAGSPAFSASASAGAPHTVDPAATTTAITADAPDPSGSGQAVVVSFTVSVSAPGAGAPAGNVTVTDGVDSCAGTVAAGSCSISLNTVGARTLVATFAGSASFTGSAAPGVPHVVTAAATTTGITNAASLASTPSVVGEPVAVTFSVTPNPPAVGTPTGNVTVSDGVDSCTATAAAGTCSLTLVTPGARTLTATYAGDASFGGSSSAGAPHTVNAAGTTVVIVSAQPEPSVAGQPVTVTFDVTVNPPGAGTPAGSVSVTDGADSCTGTVAAGSCVLTPGTAGARTLTATYAGDASFTGATSVGTPHTVTAVASALAVTAIPAAGPAGILLRASAALSGGVNPTGSILFELFSPAMPIGSGPPVFTETILVAAGNGTYTTAGGFSANVAGTWQWRATYSGDGNNAGQSSAPVSVTIQAAESATIPAAGPTGLALLAFGLAAAGAAFARRRI